MSFRYADPEDGNWTVGVDKLHHLINLCGGDLKKFESFYLLRRSNYVSFRDFQIRMRKLFSMGGLSDAKL